MLRRRTADLIKRAGFQTPFTFSFILFAAAVAGGFFFLRSRSGLPDSAFKDIFDLLLLISLWFGASILLLGFFSVAISYFFFRITHRSGRGSVRIKTGKEDESGDIGVRVHIQPILRPLMGFIRIRINYDQSNYSEKFPLTQANEAFFSLTIDGTYHWRLPHIKEYEVNRAFIYFEDLFRFFSFTAAVNCDDRFLKEPEEKNIEVPSPSPRHTEQTTTRIEELKKVEGELINYKNFESHDDVRRIVWKIYARNKELVIRIPEILDPYASHITVYHSFHSIFDHANSEVLRFPFLNYYKNASWAVFTELMKKGFELSYQSDQKNVSGALKSEEQVRRSLTVSEWQDERTLRELVKGRHASVVIISSLNDPAELDELAEQHGNNITFIIVPLSAALSDPGAHDWLHWMFIEEEKHDRATYRTLWKLSELRQRVKKNEEELIARIRSNDRYAIATV